MFEKLNFVFVNQHLFILVWKQMTALITFPKIVYKFKNKQILYRHCWLYLQMLKILVCHGDNFGFLFMLLLSVDTLFQLRVSSSQYVSFTLGG